MVNIFTCRCPNRSGVGAIDSPDLFEQVLDQRYIPEVSEKIFTHDISMIRRQKMVIFGVLKVFIGPRHNPNPSLLRNFCVKNITDKKFRFSSEK